MAIVDICLEGGWGIVLAKRGKAAYPKVEMVALTRHDHSQDAERALRAGARGNVRKREATKKIIPAIR
jgi:DNA-binding NarL/FixJ family response regulator